jgi:hypothetical protein
LHSLFAYPPQSTLLLFFSVTLFAIHPQLAHCFLSYLKKSISQSTHRQKKSGTPTATTVPEMRQKKTTQSYYT